MATNDYVYASPTSSNKDYQAFVPQQYKGGSVYTPFQGTNYLNQFESKFTPQNFNAWGQLQKQQQQLGQTQALNQMQAGAQGALGSGLSSLAQTGGISSGSRERLAQDVTRQRMMGAQDLAMQGQGQRLGIASDTAAKNAEEQGRYQGLWGQMANAQGGRDMSAWQTGEQMKQTEEQRGLDVWKTLTGIAQDEQHLSNEATAGQTLADTEAKQKQTELDAKNTSPANSLTGVPDVGTAPPPQVGGDIPRDAGFLKMIDDPVAGQVRVYENPNGDEWTVDSQGRVRKRGWWESLG